MFDNSLPLPDTGITPLLDPLARAESKDWIWDACFAFPQPSSGVAVLTISAHNVFSVWEGVLAPACDRQPSILAPLVTIAQNHCADKCMLYCARILDVNTQANTFVAAGMLQLIVHEEIY